MLTLYLLRHAKSSWGDAGLDDSARPLNPRGRRAAPRIGEEMHRLGLLPRLVLCSSAQRARETLDLVLPFLTPTPRVEFDDALYLATPEAMLRRLRQADTSPVLLVGHNPGMEQMACRLAGHGDARALAEMADRYPTGALAEIRFDADRWHRIEPEAGTLVRYLRPRELAETSR